MDFYAAVVTGTRHWERANERCWLWWFQPKNTVGTEPKYTYRISIPRLPMRSSFPQSGEIELFLECLTENWRQFRHQALCIFAEKLTMPPGEMKTEAIASLKRVGLDDSDIQNVVQMIGYSNSISRSVDGPIADPEVLKRWRSNDARDRHHPRP